MIHGDEDGALDALKEEAKSMVMHWFVDRAEADGTPATLRAMYVMKVAEARTVAAGGESSMLSAEANIRGITLQQMAGMILQMSAVSEAQELQRMMLNKAIDDAPDESTIVALLQTVGLVLQP